MVFCGLAPEAKEAAMIIECPNCGTKYNVTREAIHPKGRTVRCASCGTQWFETGEKFDPVDLPVRLEAVDDFATGPEPAAAEDRAVPPQDEDFAAVAELETGPDAAAAEALTAQRTHSAAPKLPGPEKAHGKLVPALVSLALAAAFAALLIVPVLVFRSQIAQAWPASSRVYAMFHPAQPIPGAGLSFHDVHAALRTEDKTITLSIDGLIEASGAKVKAGKLDVPPIRAALVKDGTEVKQWVFQPGIGSVTMHGPARFSTTLDGTGAGEGAIRLTFAPAGDMEAAKAVEK